MIVFISGGARSGKSQFAEQTALALFNKTKGESSLTYIATAKKSDAEMVERIKIHQQEREKEWQTVEESFDLIPVLLSCKKDDVILVDCLTIWLSNVMFELEDSIDVIEHQVKSWISLAREKQFHLLVVSNDVNEGIPTSDEGVHTYMYALQRLHQTIVHQAELAVEVQAGVPTYWKGERE